MARKNYFKQDAPEKNGLNVNGDIRAREVRLIDAEGENVGVVHIKDARSRAYEAGLDLIEVSPQAKPPVCKIADYGKLQYEQKKKTKKNESKNKMEIKEIRFGCSIGTHDLEIKAKQARTFIQKGWKVKLSVKFKGREMQHSDIGVDLIHEMVKMVGEDIAKLEQEPSKDGRFLNSMMVAK